MKSSDKKELLNFKNKNITETLDEITSIKQHQEINLSKNKFYCAALSVCYYGSKHRITQ